MTSVIAARCFLAWMFMPYGDEPGLSVEIRTIDAEKQVTQRWFGMGAMQQAAEYAVASAAEADVFFGVLPRMGRGGHISDVAGAAWLYCDIDRGEGSVADVMGLAVRFIDTHKSKPSFVVCTSSGGGHFYWPCAPVRFSTPDDRRCHAEKLKRLCHAIGDAGPGAHADRAACDVARVLRVPGTLYHKVSPPTPVRCAFIDGGSEPVDLPMLPVRSARFAVAPPQPDAPVIAGDAELIEAMFASKHGAEIRALWDGVGVSDESRSDLGLMRRLAWWTGRDAARMERLFGMSALGRREKWVARADYRSRTVEMALT